MKHLQRLISLLAIASLAACSSSSSGGSTSAQGAHYKVGSPYQVDGNWYSPKEDYSYDETGIASWYGEAFHNGTTANGEIFNKNELTAAHKTLPLPTLARITNLDNGRSIVVRINDRGPFSGARIIDVSQRAAQLLGFEQQGTAKVRVQVLADESKAIADAMHHYGNSETSLASKESQSTVPPPLASAGVAPVTSETLAAPTDQLAENGLETKILAPTKTTPAIHQQLVDTEPVEQIEHVNVTGSRQIYVQAGAFNVLENATKLKQRLTEIGPVTISDIRVNGTLFHRVRVGPIANVAQADAVLTKVRNAGISNARTIVD